MKPAGQIQGETVKRSRKSSHHRDRPDPTAQRLGARVRALRKAQGFTFDAFVEETGLGRGYVSELERGLVVPSLTVLERVAAALEMTLADLVAGHSPREQLLESTRRLTDPAVRKVMAYARELESSQPSAPGTPTPFTMVARSKGTVPVLSVRPAAGAYSVWQPIAVLGWMRPRGRVSTRTGLFLARVEGDSMQPTISDGAWCTFERPWAQPRIGEVGIFMRQLAEEGPEGGRFTVKEYHPRLEARADGPHLGGALRARNRRRPDFSPRAGDEALDRPFARFVSVLRD